jgi:cytochrome c-type biogenesis protein CcmH/NrfG
LAVERLTVAQAAAQLGVSQDAIRKRIRRNTIDYDQDPDGRIYVYVDSSEIAQDESSDASIERLVQVQHDDIEFLRRELETRTEEIRRRDSIIAALTQRLPEIEAPSEPRLTLEETTENNEARVEHTADSREVRRGGARKPWWRKPMLVALLSLGAIAAWLISLLVALSLLYP